MTLSFYRGDLVTGVRDKVEYAIKPLARVRGPLCPPTKCQTGSRSTFSVVKEISDDYNDMGLNNYHG